MLFPIGQCGTEVPAIGFCKGALGETGQKIKTYFKHVSPVSNLELEIAICIQALGNAREKIYKCREIIKNTHISSDHYVLPST